MNHDSSPTDVVNFPRNTTHPEQREGEQLVLNLPVGETDHHILGFKTARIGEMAFARTGEHLVDYRPVFVQVDDILEHNPPNVLEWFRRVMSMHTGLLKQ